MQYCHNISKPRHTGYINLCVPGTIFSCLITRSSGVFFRRIHVIVLDHLLTFCVTDTWAQTVSLNPELNNIIHQKKITTFFISLHYYVATPGTV